MAYEGVRVVELTNEELAIFYETQVIDIDKKYNEYLIIKNNDKIIDKYRYTENGITKVKNHKFKNTTILKPLDDIQLCAYDAMFSDDINVVCLTGKAGTAKTKTALSVGLELIKQQKYKKLIFLRHPAQHGEKMGYMPGDKYEKLLESGLIGAAIDNLPGGKYELEQLMKTEQVELESLSLIKGRNYQDTLIIFDEAEDCTKDQMLMLGTRLCDSSKCFIIGDLEQVSEKKYRSDSGLQHLIKNAYGEKWFCHIQMISNGRGNVATWFGENYMKDGDINK